MTGLSLSRLTFKSPVTLKKQKPGKIFFVYMCRTFYSFINYFFTTIVTSNIFLKIYISCANIILNVLSAMSINLFFLLVKSTFN